MKRNLIIPPKTISRLFCIFLLFKVVYANVPLIPVIYLISFPFLSAIRTAGIALIAIILIEGLVLRNRENISYREALQLSTKANLLSTAIGLVIAFIYSSSLFVILVGIPMSFLFARMLKSFSVNTDFLKGFSKRTLLVTFIFALIIVIIAPIIGAFTIPGYSYINIHGPTEFSNITEIIVAIVAAFCLTTIGFVLSFVSEGFIIAKYISKRSSGLVSTIFRMNFASYTALLITSAFFIWRTILERNWFWHR